MKKPNTIIENGANLENHKINKNIKRKCRKSTKMKKNKKVLENEDNADNHRHAILGLLQDSYRIPIGFPSGIL